MMNKIREAGDLDGSTLKNSEDASALKNSEEEPDLMSTADTLVFVDADGVINVGIRDTPSQSPLLLCTTNLMRSQQSKSKTGPSHIICAAAARDIGHGDEGTFSKFATAPGSFDICSVFAERLAEIHRLAGPNCVLVLSSSWRKACHQERVVALEAALSRSRGKQVCFDSRTRPGGDEPEKRLQLIGDYVQEYSEARGSSAGPLRVLVLEDFAATHPKQWKFGSLRSTSAIEQFWRGRSLMPHQTFVKLVHTYDEWTTEDGALVQVGIGLTNQKLCEAERFLGGSRELCTQMCGMCSI
jgi:hypothetical protein